MPAKYNGRTPPWARADGAGVDRMVGRPVEERACQRDWTRLGAQMRRSTTLAIGACPAHDVGGAWGIWAGPELLAHPVCVLWSRAVRWSVGQRASLPPLVGSVSSWGLADCRPGTTPGLSPCSSLRRVRSCS